MAGISRSFRRLAKSLGRVGAGEESFGSPRTIQPTLDADLYEPPSLYGVWSGVLGLAGAANVWHFLLRGSPAMSFGPVHIHNLGAFAVNLNVWSQAMQPPLAIPVAPTSLSDGTASQVQFQAVAAVPTVALPANALQIQVVPAGIIPLGTGTDTSLVHIEMAVLNQGAVMGFWWTERQPVI